MNEKKFRKFKNFKINNLSIGKKIVFTKKLTEKFLSDSLVYLEDNHPVHLDKSWAKNLGYNKKIFPGFSLIGVFSNLIGTKLPGINSVIMDVQFSFKHPAYVGDKLLFSCTVKKVFKNFNVVKLNLEVKNEKKKIIMGEAKCKILK